MLTCNPCITAEDWYDCLGKDFKLDCKTRLCMLNDVLLEMRIDIYEFKINIVTQQFSSTLPLPVNGVQLFNTDLPIYRMEGFYACGSCCGGCNLIDLDIDCGCSCSCGGSAKGIKMYDAGNVNLNECQFNYCRDGKQMEAHFPDSITSGWFKYYRGFDPISDLSDCIPLQTSLLPGLKMLMFSHYLPKSGSSYQGDDAQYRALYDAFIEKQKDRDVFRIKEIKGFKDF